MQCLVFYDFLFPPSKHLLKVGRTWIMKAVNNIFYSLDLIYESFLIMQKQCSGVKNSSQGLELLFLCTDCCICSKSRQNWSQKFGFALNY